MRNLIIDIGNTWSKIAVFEQREMIFMERYNQVDIRTLVELKQAFDFDSSILSNVNQANDQIEIWLKNNSRYVPFSTSIAGEITSLYKSNHTLGLDRWAKVIAAHRLYPNENCLLIDVGTCTTYDLLRKDAVYHGGSISLGIQMRFNALNHFTKRLPLVNWSATDWTIDQGDDTQTAIKTGVLQGLLHEVKGFIELNSEKYASLKIILSGGDSIFLTKPLKNSIFAPQIVHEPYLVLKGLNEAISLENE